MSKKPARSSSGKSRRGRRSDQQWATEQRRGRQRGRAQRAGAARSPVLSPAAARAVVRPEHDQNLIVARTCQFGCLYLGARQQACTIEGEADVAARDPRCADNGLYNRSLRMARRSMPASRRSAPSRIVCRSVARWAGIGGFGGTAQRPRSFALAARPSSARSPTQVRYIEALARDQHHLSRSARRGQARPISQWRRRSAQLDSRVGRSAGAVTPGGRGRRATRLPARRHEGQSRSVPAPALRRAIRYAPRRTGRAPAGIGRDRNRTAGLHARPHPRQCLHHPR